MEMINLDMVLFLAFAFVAIACGINLVVQTHPISSALSLIGVMTSLAVIYLLLGGEFIFAAQLIVYAGAIMVLFTFVIMLLNAGAETTSQRPSPIARYLGIPIVLSFAALLGLLMFRLLPRAEMVRFGEFTGGTARAVGEKLFTQYLLPFEITTVLILIAIIGAIILARKEVN